MQEQLSEEEKKSKTVFHTIWQHRYLDLQTIKPDCYKHLLLILNSQTRKVFDSNTVWVNHLAFDYKENQFMAQSAHKPVALWDIFTGKKLPINTLFKKFNNKQEKASIKLLDDGHILEITINNPKNKILLKGHSDKINCSALNPSANQVATGSRDMTVRLWNKLTGLQTHILSNHHKAVTCIQYNYNGTQLASGGEDCTVSLWDAVNGDLLHSFNDHTKSITCLVFSPSNKHLACGGHDRQVYIWNLTLLKKFREQVSKALPVQQILLLDKICTNIDKGLTTIINEHSGEHSIFRALPHDLYDCLTNYVKIT
jgi:WD40 repeat protein